MLAGRSAKARSEGDGWCRPLSYGRWLQKGREMLRPPLLLREKSTSQFVLSARRKGASPDSVRVGRPSRCVAVYSWQNGAAGLSPWPQESGWSWVGSASRSAPRRSSARRCEGRGGRRTLSTPRSCRAFALGERGRFGQRWRVPGAHKGGWQVDSPDRGRNLRFQKASFTFLLLHEVVTV